MGRWVAGEGQGAFKKARPASACESRADAARRSRRGLGRALREVDGAPDVRGRRGSGCKRRAARGGRPSANRAVAGRAEPSERAERALRERPGRAGVLGRMLGRARGSGRARGWKGEGGNGLGRFGLMG